MVAGEKMTVLSSPLITVSDLSINAPEFDPFLKLECLWSFNDLYGCGPDDFRESDPLDRL